MSKQVLKDLELYIYKNNLQNESLLNLLGRLSNKSIKSILSDFEVKHEINPNENTLYIHSDGNCKKNGKKDAVAGFSVYFANDLFSKFNTTKLVETNEKTNNIAELHGIHYIVNVLNDNKELFENYNIIICTDSMYSINCRKWSKNWIKNNWKNSKNEPVKNKELIQSILALLSDKITFKHIFSHTQEPLDKNSLEWMLWNGNNICDTNINKLLEKV